jgi:hypothetical protein
VAWQGQFDGSKGYPTVVLEAFADYNLWIWHAEFGMAGTNNDIDIWERSSLLAAFLNGKFHSEVDFEFNIAGRQFTQVWLMTDGIYPELSRFVKTIQEPGDPKKKVYAAWQESARKDVERAFGVLQRKFHILVKHTELWYLEEICSIVETTIIMHNMMVAHRMEQRILTGTNFQQMMAKRLRWTTLIGNMSNSCARRWNWSGKVKNLLLEQTRQVLTSTWKTCVRM